MADDRLRRRLSCPQDQRALDMAKSLKPELEAKRAALVARLGELGSAVVAYSGGVDSSLVAYLAHQILGGKGLWRSPPPAPA